MTLMMLEKLNIVFPSHVEKVSTRTSLRVATSFIHFDQDGRSAGLTRSIRERGGN